MARSNLTPMGSPAAVPPPWLSFYVYVYISSSASGNLPGRVCQDIPGASEHNRARPPPSNSHWVPLAQDPMPRHSAATVCSDASTLGGDGVLRAGSDASTLGFTACLDAAFWEEAWQLHGNCMANGNRMANCMVCLACYARSNDLFWGCGPDPSPFGICPRCATTELKTATTATSSQLAPTTATTRQRRRQLNQLARKCSSSRRMSLS